MNTTLVCFLEELSAKVFLEGVLARLLPGYINTQYVIFEGKQDMEKQLVHKMRHWRHPNSVFLIMRDQDSADCLDVKAKLLALCESTQKEDFLVRVACHELESFYFGDLDAVETALQISGVCSYKQRAGYRIPDQILNPSRALERITNGVYQKVGGSREIGKVISLDANTSRSFSVLISGIRQLCGCKGRT